MTGRTETLLLTRSDVARLLPMPDCIAAVEDGFRAQAAGRTVPTAVMALHAPDGGFHVKAAGLRLDRLYVAAKINANFPGNPESRGLPTIQGVVALYDGEDGRLLALLDSIEITALRTGAATAVAAKYMARAEADSLALCGCGVQASYQVRALLAVRPIREVRVHDRDSERARRFAAELGRETGCRVTAAEDWSAAMRRAEIIVTCTPSLEPIVTLDDVMPGVFVAGVGADNPRKQELAPSLLAGARVVVDSVDQAVIIGDLHHAIAAGTMSAEDVKAELWEVVSGRKTGRASPDEVTLFDSTGIAIEDVAAAALVFERALRAGHGRSLDLGA